MTKLDEIALNIELILISIIEAVALTFLGENATHMLVLNGWVFSLPFILAGLMILLVFWAQAILHAISFIRWPLRIEHTLLYFLAVFLQIVAYSFMDDLFAWFFWWTLFSIVAFAIYVVDLRIIRSTKATFAEKKEGSAYIDSAEKRHLFEMKYLVPAAVAFNLFALFAVSEFGSMFQSQVPQMILAYIQFLISLGALIDCVHNFRVRALAIAKVF